MLLTYRRRRGPRRRPTARSGPTPGRGWQERFIYRLTPEAKKLLAEHGRTNGKAAFTEAPCTEAVAETLDSDARIERKRRRRKEARARGVRLGTVCGRWRDGRRLPDLRMTGR
jgi:hypothetical protein